MTTGDNNKSVLDNVEVKEHGFPLGRGKAPDDEGASGYVQLPIAGHCPACGAPIYGPDGVAAVPKTVPIRYSCDCRNANAKPKTLADTTHVK